MTATEQLTTNGRTKNFQIPERDLMHPGHLACPGCGASLAMRLALKALGERTMVVVPACCWSIIAGPYPTSAVDVPLFHTAFETAAATASGLRASLETKGINDVTVMAWAGDGGTFDIGLQALSGAAERNEDFLYVCYDNEAYMNTGIQRSGATPEGAWTTTTPQGHVKTRPKKDITRILAAHGVPYIATASVAYPDDLIGKFQKAKEIRGTKFIHLFSPCPPGWKIDSEESIEVARLAVHTKVFPLYEIVDGEQVTINVEPTGLPVDAYFKAQGRFRYMEDDALAHIQADVDKRWTRLIREAGRED